MPDLTLEIHGASPVLFAVEPRLAFDLRIENAPADERIHTVVLRAQIQLDVTRRQYSHEEEQRLGDLFGRPERWGQTLRGMLWTHTNVVVPAFAGETHVKVQVPCSFDFNVAATKYFHGLSDGDVPLTFLFSGTVFYQDLGRGLQVAPISWSKESAFRLPVAVWKELIDHYYPNVAWLQLRRDIFEQLRDYKTRHGIPTWEETVERLLPSVTEGVTR